MRNYLNALLTIYPMWVHKSILALVAAKSRNFLVAAMRLGRWVDDDDSMCDDACCDFLAKRIQNQISHIDWCRLGRCAMMHVVIFGPAEYKSSYRISTGVDSVGVRCAMMHVVIFWPAEYKSGYRISTGVDSIEVRWCMLWFSGQENTKADIAHRLASTRSMSRRWWLDVRWSMLWFSGQENTKAAIAYRLVSTRSKCDDACCDFLAKRIQKQLSHIDWCRLGRSAMMHVVIFWPREYKNRYRTSTGVDRCGDSLANKKVALSPPDEMSMKKVDKDAVFCSRRQLIPLFDKPAF